MPAICIVGEEDGATPPELMRQTADLIPGCGYEVIKGAGHLPCIEQPEILSGLILKFVEEKGLV